MNNIIESTNFKCGIDKNVIYKCPNDRFCNSAVSDDKNRLGYCDKQQRSSYYYKNLDGSNVSKYRNFTYEYINNKFDLLKDLSNNYILDTLNNKLLNLNNNPVNIDKNNPYFDISNNLAFISEFNNNIPISKDGNCGVQYGYKCPIGQCCSENGKCGFNKETCYYPNLEDSVSIPNRVFYSDYDAILNFRNITDKQIKNKQIKDIANKYVFETSSDGNCGINLKYDKIVKCPENQCCSRQNKCGTSDNYCDNKFNFKDFNINNLDSNLMHGNNALENYKKEVTQKLDNDYKNNSFKTDDNICGYDYDIKKVLKCSNNNCCVNDKCTNDKEICKNALLNSKLHGDKFIPIIPEIKQEIKPEQVPEIKREKKDNNIISLILLIILILFIISSVIYFIYYRYKNKRIKIKK